MTGIGVSISEIDTELRPASQMRQHLNGEAIEEYAERLASMPPVRLMFDREAGLHWVVDGAHTISAAKSKGLDDIPAEVATGTYEDAWREASRCNETHGVKRTTGDRHAALMRAAEKWPGMSLRWYAEMCNVSDMTAGRVLGQLQHCCSSPDGKTEGRDGKRRKPPTPKQPEPDPEPEDDTEESEEQSQAPTPRRTEPKPKPLPPCFGMWQAQRAIEELERIEPNDTEREQAFSAVRSWLDARQV